MNIKVELNPAFKKVNESPKRYIIMKGEKKLFELEEKLAFMEKTMIQEKQIQEK